MRARSTTKTHPDRGGRKSLFVAVNKAYAVLADEQLRATAEAKAEASAKIAEARAEAAVSGVNNPAR